MKYDTDHVGFCHRCGASLCRGDRWVRTAKDARLYLWCRPCFLLEHPESAMHGGRFTHPEDAER